LLTSFVLLKIIPVFECGIAGHPNLPQQSAAVVLLHCLAYKLDHPEGRLYV
jgi:hypothetical protein